MILGPSSTVTGGRSAPRCGREHRRRDALLPVVDLLAETSSIGRVCVVADRGIISAEIIAGPEQRKLQYILGARSVRRRRAKIVLENDDPCVPSVSARRERRNVRQAGEGEVVR